MTPEDFIHQHLVECETQSGGDRDSEFFPPVPVQPQGRVPLSGASLTLELIPALARMTVELPRDTQRAVTFQPGCPARLMLERITQVHILECNTLAAQNRLKWLSRLTRHALELGDEIHQFDGSACLDFAAGFISGETSSSDLFGGETGEAAALASAFTNRYGAMATTPSRPFELGFRTRRDQLRAARQNEIDSI